MNIWKIKKTMTQRIWVLLLAVCMVLGCMPIISLTASAQVTGNGYTISTGNMTGSNLLGSANSSTDTGDSGTGSSTDTGTIGTTESGTGATDSTAGTAYGQDTGTCTCGNRYINGICSNADCTAPYQEPSTDESGVYQISNAGNLYWFAAKVNSGSTTINAKLTADITVNKNLRNSLTFDDNGNVTNGDSFRQWTPIGNGSNQYTGTFDGQDHTISGLYYSNGTPIGNVYYIGLFGYLEGGASIKNVGLIDSYFSVVPDTSSNYTVCLGGIVAQADNSATDGSSIVISGCYNEAVLCGETSWELCSISVGGIVGGVYVSSSCTGKVEVKNCHNTGSVSGESSGYGANAFVGGVVGAISVLNSSVTVTGCYNTSSVNGRSSFNTDVGGVIGNASAGGGIRNGSVTVSDCYNTGELKGTGSTSAQVGGTVGQIEAKSSKSSVTVSNCYNAGGLSGTNCGGVAGGGYTKSGTITVNNCYFTNTDLNALQESTGNSGSISVDENTTSVAAADVTSGKVTYLLNGGRTPSVWLQGDNGPAFEGHKIGYNSETEIYVLMHDFVGGVCKICDLVCAHDTTNETGCATCDLTYAAKLELPLETKYYFTVAEAFENMGNSATITLLKDAEITSTITISNGYADITLIGGEHTLSAACTMFRLTKGTLTIKSGTYITTGDNVFYVTGDATVPDSSSSDSEGTITVPGIGNKGDVSTEIPGISTGNITVDIPGAGTTTTAANSGTLKIDGGTFTSNSHTVYVARDIAASKDPTAVTTNTEKGKAEISGGIFTSEDGYAIYVGTESTGIASIGGELIVSGGEFNGGLRIISVAVFATADVSVTLSGGTFDRINYNKKADILQQYYAYFTKDASGAYTVLTAAADVGTNAVQIKLCTHVYTKADGACDLCGKTCDHPTWNSATGACSTCGYGHVHSDYDEDGFCTVCGGYPMPSKDASGIYLIANAGNLYWFAQQVNSGNTSINGMLTADIVVNKNLLNSLSFDTNGNVTNGDNFRMWTPIGNNQYGYKGTFNGNQKTISGLYYNSNGSYSCVGLFGCISDGANIRNVGVVDNYFHVSGENENMFCCYVGGLVGYVYSSGSKAITVENCYHTGKVSESAGAKFNDIGGLVGYIWREMQTQTSVSVTIQNCYNTGAVSSTTPDANVGALIGCAYADGCIITIQECYWLNTSANQGIGSSGNVSGSGTLTTAAEFASGAVAWLLNGGKSDGVWKQTIGTDTSPNFTGGNVYPVHACDGSTISDSVYANSAGKKLSHVNANGTCSGCGQALAVTATVGETIDYYVTLTEAFAAASGKTATITLMCDTTLTSTVEISDSKSNITLVGDTHTVSAACTMFRVTAGTLTIKSGKYTTTSGNVIDVSGTTTDSTTSSGSGSSSGEAGLYTPSTDIGVTIPTTTVGTVNIEGGNFTSDSGYAVYVDTAGDSLVGNCGKLNVSGGSFGKLYIAGLPTDEVVLTGGTFTGIEFKLNTTKGTLCAAILKNGYGFFDGDGKGVKLTDVSGEVAGTVKLCTAHGWDSETGKCTTCGYNCPHGTYENGFCKSCNAYEPCEGEGTAEKPYLIKNAGNLYWFAAKVNSGEYNACAKLTADITVNPGKFDADGNYTVDGASATPRDWTPIAQDVIGAPEYKGTFDGNNKYISGLYANVTTSVGLFGIVGEDGTVKNVAVKDSYFKGESGVGGVVGSNSGTITGCYNSGTVSGSHYVGGVVGDNSGTITNCYNTGTVSGTASFVGGVVGSNSGTITNCYYLTGCASSGIGYGDGEATAMTAAEFKSGEVTWLLNGKRSEGTDEDPLVWYQTIGTDDFPSFSGKVVYYDGTYYNEKIASVTIVWTAMSFSYNKGTWNTDTMTWEGGGWEADAGCGTVTVTNTGDLDVTAQFGVTFTNDTLGISVSFTENGTALTDNKLTVAKGAEKTVTVKLTGNEPSEYIETATTIGQITITLTTE